jgi:limonene 1,2-monooxygenase
MKFGLFFMPLHAPEECATLGIESDLRYCELADRLGYDEVWIGEHHTSGWETIASPEMFLAAASQRTSRIKLGTGVLTAPLHNPVQAAERITLLDHLSRGRVMLGMGPGLLSSDLKMFGLTSKLSRERIAEEVEIMIGLLHGDEPFSYHGKHYELDDVWVQLRPVQNRLPIALTTSGPASSATTLAAKHDLIMISGNFFATPNAVMGEHFTALAEQSAGFGHPARRDDWRLATYIYVSESREKALEEISVGAQRFIKDYLFSYAGAFVKPKFEAYEGQPSSDMTIEQLAEKAGWIIGDPDSVTRQVAQLEADTGGIGTLLTIGGGWTRPADFEKSMDLFARYVIPNFKGPKPKGLAQSFQRTLDNPIPMGSV